MKEFNPEKESEKIVEFIQGYYKENNLKGVVIGISGGKDSAIVAALFTKALGKENVLGVTIPCHSKEEDKHDAKLISDYYGFELINFDVTNTFNVFKDELKKLGNFNNDQTNNSDINLKPKLRTAVLYYLAALYSNLKKGTYIVAGTSNKCELYVGYFTKGGDSVQDISILADFTVEEVIALGEYLNVPKKVLYKIPHDGLSSMTDEQKLGVTYTQIASYLENQDSVSKDIRNKIEKLHNDNLHKFNVPTYRRNDV